MARPLSLDDALRLTLVLADHRDPSVYRRACEQWAAMLGGQVEGVPATHLELIRVALALLSFDRWLGCTVVGATLTSGGQRGLALTVRQWWERHQPPDPLLPY